MAHQPSDAQAVPEPRDESHWEIYLNCITGAPVTGLEACGAVVKALVEAQVETETLGEHAPPCPMHLPPSNQATVATQHAFARSMHPRHQDYWL